MIASLYRTLGGDLSLFAIRTKAMKLSRPTASQYLRALEACGFVAARRRGRSVVYELGGGRDAEAGIRILINALIRRFKGKSAIETTFKVATAFANAGRIEVFNSLRSGSKSIRQLRAETGFPPMTLWRHLQKLQKRGFVRQRPQSKTYEIAPLKDDFARALAAMAR